jgi:hypothetical protein
MGVTAKKYGVLVFFLLQIGDFRYKPFTNTYEFWAKI